MSMGSVIRCIECRCVAECVLNVAEYPIFFVFKIIKITRFFLKPRPSGGQELKGRDAMRAILGAVLAILAVSMAVSVEETVELGAEVAVSAKVGYVMKSEDVDSLKIVDKYAEFNKVLQKQDHEIRTALETPPEDCEPPSPRSFALSLPPLRMTLRFSHTS